MAESKEELKSFLMKVKEESEKADLKPNIPETKIGLAASPITSGQIGGKKVEAVTDFIFSVQFSHSVLSDSLQPHELQYTRPPCSSPTP